MPSRTYDILAPIYDLLSASERPFRRRGLDMLELSPSDRLLEIGCGPGRDLARAASLTRLAVGIDRSRGMLTHAIQHPRHKDRDPSAVLVQADAVALPFEESCFNALCLFFTLELFPPPVMASVLEECHRVLVPGGRLAVVSLHLPERPGQAVRVYQWFHLLLPNLVDCAPLRAAETLVGAGFKVRARETGLMWGLTVEVMVYQENSQ